MITRSKVSLKPSLKLQIFLEHATSWANIPVDFSLLWTIIKEGTSSKSIWIYKGSNFDPISFIIFLIYFLFFLETSVWLHGRGDPVQFAMIAAMAGAAAIDTYGGVSIMVTP